MGSLHLGGDSRSGSIVMMALTRVLGLAPVLARPPPLDDDDLPRDEEPREGGSAAGGEEDA